MRIQTNYLYAPCITAGIRPGLLSHRTFLRPYSLFSRPLRGDVQYLCIGLGSHHPQLAVPSKIPTCPLHQVCICISTPIYLTLSDPILTVSRKTSQKASYKLYRTNPLGLRCSYIIPSNPILTYP